MSVVHIEAKCMADGEKKTARKRLGEGDSEWQRTRFFVGFQYLETKEGNRLGGIPPAQGVGRNQKNDKAEGQSVSRNQRSGGCFLENVPIHVKLRGQSTERR